MRYFSLFIVLVLLASCQQPQPSAKENKPGSEAASKGSFGNTVSADNVVTAAEIPALFSTSDTVAVSVNGNIAASCKHSGCWMDLDMGNGTFVHVTFKDEAFTIPLDAAGKNAIAQGLAIRELIPVETLQNYAREDGKSEAEIAAITQPVYAYEFIADGVLIEE